MRCVFFCSGVPTNLIQLIVHLVFSVDVWTFFFFWVFLRSSSSNDGKVVVFLLSFTSIHGRNVLI